MANKVNTDDLMKKIDEKIAQLEKEETPNELLKRALIKKNIILEDTILSQEKLDTLFELLKNELKR